MRIGISSPSIQYPEGGVGTYIRNLLAGLARMDYQNEYLLFGNKNSFDDLGVCPCHFQLINRGIMTGNRLIRMVWEQTGYPLECAVRGVELIHAMMFVVPVLSRSKKVVTIYDMGFFNHPEYHLANKVLYFQNMIRRSAARTDLIITISQSIKEEICEILHIPDEKVIVTHLAPQEYFQTAKDEENVDTVIQRWKISKPYLLFVGTMEPRKNLRNLVQAFSVWKKEQHLEGSLVIVGRQGWKYDLDQVIRESGVEKDVLLTGVVRPDDLVALYNGSRAFVYPSFYEGFGIPILEAMACGAPVITSACSAMQEIAGGAAHLINPESVDSIVEGIHRIWIDAEYRKLLREKGLARAAQFSWDRTAAQTLQAYKSL